MENLLLKMPYKFKKSYGGTPETQTPQDAPWLHGPSLTNKNMRMTIRIMIQYYINIFLKILAVNNKRAYF
jgi:hypothetical protein